MFVGFTKTRHHAVFTPRVGVFGCDFTSGQNLRKLSKKKRPLTPSGVGGYFYCVKIQISPVCTAAKTQDQRWRQTVSPAVRASGLVRSHPQRKRVWKPKTKIRTQMSQIIEHLSFPEVAWGIGSRHGVRPVYGSDRPPSTWENPGSHSGRVFGLPSTLSSPDPDWEGLGKSLRPSKGLKGGRPANPGTGSTLEAGNSPVPAALGGRP